jgi:L-threonylcarbamoyladenylate synthase
MKTPVNPWHLKESARVLDAGGIIAYPTEAVYGLGCNPCDSDAVMRLLDLKGRPAGSGFIIVAAKFRQIEAFLQPLPAKQVKRVRDTWPGPVTWLWPARPGVPEWIRGAHDTVAVRVSSHPLVSALCVHWGGPLVSTSANPHGFRPPRSALQVRNYFGDSVDFILHGRLGGQPRPTQIRNALNGNTVRRG